MWWNLTPNTIDVICTVLFCVCDTFIVGLLRSVSVKIKVIEKLLLQLLWPRKTRVGKRKGKVTMTVVRTFRLPFANVATTWCIEQSKMRGDNQMSLTLGVTSQKEDFHKWHTVSLPLYWALRRWPLGKENLHLAFRHFRNDQDKTNMTFCIFSLVSVPYCWQTHSESLTGPFVTICIVWFIGCQ